jgi:hypothetical protein
LVEDLLDSFVNFEDFFPSMKGGRSLSAEEKEGRDDCSPTAKTSERGKA